MEKQNPRRRQKASVPAMHARSARARYVTARSHWSFLFWSRNRRPGKTARLVERLEPPLNIERLDVFRDFVSETRDEIGAHDMLHVTDGVGRFRAYRIRPEIGS